MPTASDLREWFAKLLTGMLTVSTLFLLRRIHVPAVSDLINMTVPLHLREERADEEAQLVSRTLSRQYIGGK